MMKTWLAAAAATALTTFAANAEPKTLMLHQ
jgi:hypothetical protein